MNEREKKLIFVLIAAAFIIVNVFAWSMYSSGMKRMQVELQQGTKELKEKIGELDKAAERQDERDWLLDNPPIEGKHRTVGGDLATYTERSAARYGVTIKGSATQLGEDINESGTYRSAKVKVKANGMDAAVYRWLADLQDPGKSRSITRLYMAPRRDVPSQMDCELEITQWFFPAPENEPVTTAEAEG